MGYIFCRHKRALWWVPPPRNRPAGTCRCAGAENTFNTQILLYALQEFSRPPNSKSWQFQLRAAAASWFSDVFDLYATEIRVRVRSTDDATARVLSVTCKSTLSPQNRLQGR